MAQRSTFGYVEKRGKRFRARYTGPDGERYYGPHTYGTRDAANKFLRDTSTAIDAGKWRPPHLVKAEKFGPYSTAWLEQRRTSTGSRLSTRTRTEYRRQLDNGLEPLAALALADLTPATVRAWHAKRARRGVTQASREAALLRAILNTALEDRLIERNPVPGNLTRGNTGREHRPPTPEELAALIHRMPERFTAAIYLAAFGGLRIGEWKALRRQDLTLDGSAYVVTVGRQVQRVPGKGWEVTTTKNGDARTVSLPEHATATITRHLATQTERFPDSLLFAPTGGAEYMHDSVFSKPWRDAVAGLGLAGVVREHDLRAFAGTTYAQTGATLKEVQAFLGHRTVAAAMAYQFSTGRERDLSNRMPALPAPAPANVTALADAASSKRAGGAS